MAQAQRRPRPGRRSLTGITETAGAAPLLESMPTKLFPANPDFPSAGRQTFQLRDAELKLVRQLQPKRELYVRRPHERRAVSRRVRRA